MVRKCKCPKVLSSSVSPNGLPLFFCLNVGDWVKLVLPGLYATDRAVSRDEFQVCDISKGKIKLNDTDLNPVDGTFTVDQLYSKIKHYRRLIEPAEEANVIAHFDKLVDHWRDEKMSVVDSEYLGQRLDFMSIGYNILMDRFTQYVRERPDKHLFHVGPDHVHLLDPLADCLNPPPSR